MYLCNQLRYRDERKRSFNSIAFLFSEWVLITKFLIPCHVFLYEMLKFVTLHQWCVIRYMFYVLWSIFSMFEYIFRWKSAVSKEIFLYFTREKFFKFVELFLHSEIWLKRLVYFESYQIFHFSLRHLTSKCTISMPGRYIETKMDFSIFLFLISDSLDFNSINVQLKNYKFFLFLNLLFEFLNLSNFIFKISNTFNKFDSNAKLVLKLMKLFVRVKNIRETIMRNREQVKMIA